MGEPGCRASTRLHPLLALRYHSVPVYTPLLAAAQSAMAWSFEIVGMRLERSPRAAAETRTTAGIPQVALARVKLMFARRSHGPSMAGLAAPVH